MPGVVFRYLFTEAARTWLLVIGVLLFLTLGLGLSRYIADAAAGQVPVNTVLELAGLSVVKNLEIVLPASLLLALLLAIGRLCRDNELTALFAGGAGLAVVYRPFFALALALALLSGTLSLFAAPRAELAMERLATQSLASAIASLAPGRFVTLAHGKIVFYARQRGADGALRHVFLRVIRHHGAGQPTQIVITARKAREQVAADTRQVTLILDDGWRYEGVPGQADYRIIKFGEHGIQLHPPIAQPGARVDTQPTAQLLGSHDPDAIAEWQKRVSVPISMLILTLLALPLGRTPPRAGRYGRVVVGVLLYVVYVNAIQLARHAVENQALPAVVGVWWVHGLVAALAVGLALREQGFFARLRARRPR